MLEILLEHDIPDPDRMPVTAEMCERIRDVLADRADSGLNVEAVLFQLALAVIGLEIAANEHKAQLLNLETRILEAGLQLNPPD